MGTEGGREGWEEHCCQLQHNSCAFVCTSRYIPRKCELKGFYPVALDNWLGSKTEAVLAFYI